MRAAVRDAGVQARAATPATRSRARRWWPRTSTDALAGSTLRLLLVGLVRDGARAVPGLPQPAAAAAAGDRAGRGGDHVRGDGAGRRAADDGVDRRAAGAARARRRLRDPVPGARAGGGRPELAARSRCRRSPPPRWPPAPASSCCCCRRCRWCAASACCSSPASRRVPARADRRDRRAGAAAARAARSRSRCAAPASSSTARRAALGRRSAAARCGRVGDAVVGAARAAPGPRARGRRSRSPRSAGRSTRGPRSCPTSSGSCRRTCAPSQDLQALQQATGVAGEIDVVVEGARPHRARRSCAGCATTSPGCSSATATRPSAAAGGRSCARRCRCPTCSAPRRRPSDREQIRALLDAVPPYFSSAVITADRKTANLAFGIRLTSLERQQQIIDDMRDRLDPPHGVTARLAGLPVLAAEANAALSDPLRRLGTLVVAPARRAAGAAARAPPPRLAAARGRARGCRWCRSRSRPAGRRSCCGCSACR